MPFFQRMSSRYSRALSSLHHHVASARTILWLKSGGGDGSFGHWLAADLRIRPFLICTVTNRDITIGAVPEGYDPNITAVRQVMSRVVKRIRLGMSVAG
jgi:hypothetical protein